jgi:hypothetical protein
MKRVDEYQRDVVMMSKINQSDERTEKLKREKVIDSHRESNFGVWSDSAQAALLEQRMAIKRNSEMERQKVIQSMEKMKKMPGPKV